MPHRVCLECGWYKDRIVMNVNQKREKLQARQEVRENRGREN